MPLQELDGGGYHVVDRCLPMLERMGLIAAITEPNNMERATTRNGASHQTLLPGDLFYEKRWSNGGYTLGYDVKAKRGYYQFMHH